MSEEVFTCAACGHVAPLDDVVNEEGSTADAAGVLQCPECGELDWGD